MNAYPVPWLVEHPIILAAAEKLTVISYQLEEIEQTLNIGKTDRFFFQETKIKKYGKSRRWLGLIRRSCAS